MRREKVAAEERIEVAKACAEGRISRAEAARRLGLHKSTVEEWVRRYKAGGALAFKEQEHNSVYTEEMKVAAVREYLSGSKSQREISAKYGLRSTHQLRNWIKVYNAHVTFNSAKFSGGGSYMKQRRETTQAQIENEQVADKIEKIHSESPDKGA